MRETKAVKTGRFFDRMTGLGFTWAEANELRRIEMALSRWDALCCGDSDNYKSWSIERDEKTDKPFMVIHPHDGPSYRNLIADREAGALRRAEKILSRHPDLWMYHQSDPRGCSLYIGRKADVNGYDLNSVYTRGVAVYI